MRLFIADLLAILCSLFTSCTDLIEYSPFDADVSSQDINLDHIFRIVRNPVADQDTFRFAVFSDVHEGYDDMFDAIKDINRRGDARFIIVNGDITNAGLAQEFEWYARVIPVSENPLVTVIGNHDCLANGLLIYRRMFGNPDRSFVTGNYKLILFNNVILENNLVSPNYEWLREELKGDHYNIIFSHIPPISFDIGSLHRIIYNNIADSTNTRMAIHSSAHEYYEYDYNGIHSLITTTVKEREYCLVEAFRGQFKVSRVKF